MAWFSLVICAWMECDIMSGGLMPGQDHDAANYPCGSFGGLSSWHPGRSCKDGEDIGC